MACYDQGKMTISITEVIGRLFSNETIMLNAHISKFTSHHMFFHTIFERIDEQCNI